MRIGILTVSDGCAYGEREDVSGALIAAWAHGRGYEVACKEVVPDEVGRIAGSLLPWCDELGLDLVLTTGGTGFGPRDVTPEATLAVLERLAPGIAEEIRRRGVVKTPLAVLSRGVAGTRGRTFLVNLPGSPGGVRDGLDVLSAWVDHAVGLIRGENPAHPHPRKAGGDAAPAELGS